VEIVGSDKPPWSAIATPDGVHGCEDGDGDVEVAAVA
jgi:hypothetical protein